jgi:hypothetical protein
MVSFSVNIVCAQDLQVGKHGADPGLSCFRNVFNHVFRGGWLQSLIKQLHSLIPMSIVLCMLVEALASSQYTPIFLHIFLLSLTSYYRRVR